MTRAPCSVEAVHRGFGFSVEGRAAVAVAEPPDRKSAAALELVQVVGMSEADRLERVAREIGDPLVTWFAMRSVDERRQIVEAAHAYLAGLGARG